MGSTAAPPAVRAHRAGVPREQPGDGFPGQRRATSVHARRLTATKAVPGRSWGMGVAVTKIVTIRSER